MTPSEAPKSVFSHIVRPWRHRTCAPARVDRTRTYGKSDLVQMTFFRCIKKHIDFLSEKSLFFYPVWDLRVACVFCACVRVSSFGEPPTAGRQRVFSWVASLLSSSHTWKARMWSDTAGGTGGPGQSVRASVLLSQVLTEAGVAPAVHHRGPAPLSRKSDATRTRVW